MVRTGPVVSLSLAAWLALSALAAAGDVKSKPPTKAKTAPSTGSEAQAASAPKSPADPIERRPYKIRVWVVVDPNVRLDARGRGMLLSGWRALVRRFVGAAWDFEVAEGDGPLATEGLETLAPKAVVRLAAGCDKAWMIRIEPGTTGFVFSGREFDVLTVHLGPTCRRPAPYPADAPRALLALALDMFAPTAEIGALVGGGVRITVHGASLPAASEAGRVVAVGSVFRPIRIFQRPDGSVLSIEDVRRSFLRVTELEGAVARCDIISSLRDPLSRRAARKNTLVALGVKPASMPTRLRYVMDSDRKPAAGFKLSARTVPEGLTRDLGMTDRDGRISMQPGFADGLLIFRLLAADVEPLDEFPAMPGETLEERTILINPKLQTVALETQLNALRDELIDQVATRERLKARIEAREKGQQWDEVEELLKQYRQLPRSDEYVARLTKLKDDATQKQVETKEAILTKTAMALVTDTQALIDRYLDDEFLKAYEAGLAEMKAESKKGQPKSAVAKTAVPPTRAPAAPGPATTEALNPPPAASPQPAPTAASKPFSPAAPPGRPATAPTTKLSEDTVPF